MQATGTAREAAIEEVSIEEQIRQRAYQLYVERGNQSGSEVDDWLQAEQEIMQAREAASSES